MQQGTAIPAAPTITAFWNGWDIARSVIATGAGQGYVIDGYGGVHPYGGAAPEPNGGDYWGGWDIVRAASG